MRALENYRWHDPEHRVVYEALQAVRGGARLSLREELPAHATRLGFPDVGWQDYFDCAGLGQTDIGVLVKQLKAAPVEGSS
jgi:hypothetical protein